LISVENPVGASRQIESQPDAGSIPWRGTVPVTGNAKADELNATNPLALLLGMLLRPDVPMTSGLSTLLSR